MRVLIVDDSFTITAILKRCFEEGYIVDSYNSFFEAQERLDYIPYDIFCLDVHLSEKYGEGIELCKRAREKNPESIIIMFTGSEIDGELVAKMMEAGANTFLEKKNVDAYIVHKAIHLVEEQKKKAKKLPSKQHEIYAKLEIDENHNTLSIDGSIVPLGRMSLLVLSYLHQRPNKYIHTSEIMNATKDVDATTGMSVKAHILIIRRALGKYEKHIKNAWGGWYGFFTDPEVNT